MNEMNRHLKAIEFNKILDLLSARACNSDAREEINKLRPETTQKGANRL